MELWIRSQDREKFMKVDYFYLEQNSIIGYSQSTFTSPVLAKYKSKERALEVLDEIQMYLDIEHKYIWKNGVCIEKTEKNIYEMPKE